MNDNSLRLHNLIIKILILPLKAIIIVNFLPLFLPPSRRIATLREIACTMRISFNLKNPNAERSAVRLIITHRGKVYRKYTGISVETSKWRRSKRDGQSATDPEDAAELKKIRLCLEERLNEYSTENEIEATIRAVLDGEPQENGTTQKEGVPSFWSYFREWSDRDLASKRQRKNICRLVAELMGTGTDWDGVDSSYYLRIVKRMDERRYSMNYKGAVVSKLRSVMSEGFRLKYHTNTEYREFKKVMEQPDTVYLTQDEVNRVWNVELKDETEQRCRDLFIVGVYTASRFIDYSDITKENIRGGYVRFVQHKTGDSVVLPLAPRVADVIRRNGGSVPRVNHTVFNRVIKTVCMRAGITGKVEVTRSKGAGHVTETVLKYMLVSAHTARRTGATLLYMSGVPLRQCMLITGHRSEGAFMRYIRVTKEENARQLADNPFFR